MVAVSTKRINKRRKKRRAYQGAACPSCDKALGSQLTLESWHDGPQVCRSCKVDYKAYRLTPIVERQTVVTPLLADSTAAPCARHERNVSVASCGRCGVFMCDLCRIESDGLVLCPGCFERLAEEGALPSARKSYKDYSLMSLHFGVVGFLLTWPFGIFLGPFAIWFGIKGLRAQSLPGVHISKGRSIFGLILGLLSIVIFVGIIMLIIYGITKSGRL